MISLEINNYDQAEWNAIVSKMEGMSLIQTWEYAEAKQKTGPWQVNRAVFKRDNGEIIGATHSLIRNIPLIKRGLVWINRGPLFKNKDMLTNGEYLEILINLRNYWVMEMRMYLRIAPPIKASLNNYNMLQYAGFRRTSTIDGWASDIIDLTQPIDALRENLHQKWRNCLNKAERLGLKCEIGTSQSLLKDLLLDYHELMSKKNIESIENSNLIMAMQRMLPESNKMTVIAGRNNEGPLGSVLIAGSGNTCTYLIGATNENGRHVNANHFLLWNAICEMKKKGFMFFDLGGVNPVKTPKGILHFKSGMRGTHCQLVCELEASRNTFLDKIIGKKIASTRT